MRRWSSRYFRSLDQHPGSYDDSTLIAVSPLAVDSGTSRSTALEIVVASSNVVVGFPVGKAVT